jgi:hypothetical protein
MTGRRRLTPACVAMLLGLLLASAPLDHPAAQAKPEGEMRWALDVTSVSRRTEAPGEMRASNRPSEPRRSGTPAQPGYLSILRRGGLS